MDIPNKLLNFAFKTKCLTSKYKRIMESLLNTKSTDERDLTFKKISEKYAYFEDSYTTTYDDGETSTRVVRGITSIRNLKKVIHMENVRSIVKNKGWKNNYYVVAFTKEEYQKLITGRITFGNCKYDYAISEYDPENYVYVLVCESDFTVRSLEDEKLIPIGIYRDYMNGHIDNANYDLDKCLERILSMPERFVPIAENHPIAIEDIPYYNADNERNKTISFIMLPTQEEYEEYVNGAYYYKDVSLMDKYFGEFKINH